MRKALFIFYLIAIYAFAEMMWWGWLLLKAEPGRMEMIVGETIVFLCLFIIGVVQIHKTLNGREKLQEQQKNFLLSVTHELKSPLASIKLSLQTILKRDLQLEQKQALLGNSLKDIERLDDLVENMLLATKIENRSYSFPKDKINLSELVEKVVERLQVHACDSQTIKCIVKPNIYISGDQFAINSLLINLIENAVKYSPACAEVEVSLDSKKEQVCMRVADHGTGIPDAEKNRIFEKFYRIGSENTRQTKGTGLGLYIVKKVLDIHQAGVQVLDNTPRGTIFEITFSQHHGN
ncbi:MAG: sensor histidine kinase [Sphingobacteriaceae bacterium]